MADRTFKFYGQAFSPTGTASVNVTFNGIEIYSGSVAATNSLAAPAQPTDFNQVLCEYNGSTDLVGDIPFELHVTSGTVFFGKVTANYSGFKVEQLDYVPPKNFWGEVNNNSIETDGKSSVLINGVAQVREIVDSEQIGDWWYRIFENETFTCNIFIDPDIIVTTIPE